MAKKRKNKRMRKRRWFTATERVEVWDRWQRGESSQSIGRVLERGGSAIHRQLAVYGGIRPQSRCRSSRALTRVEREEISRGIAAKESVRSIAVRLGRSPSTVSREVSRNGGSDSYRASEADERTWERARRRKSCRLARSPRLRQLVEEKLRQVWSPEQIAGWLKHSYPEDESLHVSHETIYRSLFVQARGVLKKELTQYLRTKRTIRRSGKASRKGHGKGQIEDMISIRERPASVEDRAVPGHWEGDLIAGSRHTYIATLVERHSRYVMLAKVPNKKTETVVNALIEQAHPLPTELYKSLTWIAVWKWRITSGLPWRQTLPSISATHGVHGSADRMRTPMVCFDTTFQKGRTCRYTHRNIWTRLLGNSTSGHARRWSSQLRQKHLMHVLHRPVEPAPVCIPLKCRS